VKQIVGGAQPASRHDNDKAGQPLHFGWPAHGSVIRHYGRTDNGHVNNGLDIAASIGSPIFATEDGHVAYTGTHISVLGGVILIQHAQGWTSVYGHLDKIKVKQGDFVRKGEVIASAGESGNTPRPQLHQAWLESGQPRPSFTFTEIATFDYGNILNLLPKEKGYLLSAG